MAKLAASCLLVLNVCYTADAGHLSQWYEDGRQATFGYHTTTTTSSWWEAVRGGCDRGRVFIPNSDELPDDITQKMTPGQYYWMGAIAYSTWKWTDGSPFYKYVGYSTELLSNSDGQHVEGNSASRCHLKCEKNEPFGLKGETCYCEVSDQIQMTSNQTEVRCSGNYDDRCGNQHGISVYRSGGEITIDTDDGGRCVYAQVRLGLGSSYHSSRCDSSRSAACENGTVLNELDKKKCRGTVCVYQNPNQWDEANRTCNLLTVTSSNKEDLYDAMKYRWPFQSEKKYTYWIGLRRGYVKKWLNGSDYVDRVTPYTTDKLCLSATSTSLFHWEDCSSTLPTICESAFPESTRSIGTVTTTATAATAATAATTIAMSGLNTRTSITSPTTTTATATTTIAMSGLNTRTSITRVVIENTTEPFTDNHVQGNNNDGLYYGLSGLGVVTVAVAITLLLVMYKQERGCFTPVDPKADNLALASTDNGLYLMGVQTEQGTALQQSAAPNCGDDEYDLLGQNIRVCPNEETGNAVFKDPVPYNRLGHGAPMSHHGRGAYDHVLESRNIQVETYDHAGDNGPSREGDDVYDHAGDSGTVRKGDDVYDYAGDSGTARKGDDLYDHAGDSGTVRKDVYDHAGDSGTVRKGVYDHAGDNGTVRKGDDVYDHAGDNGPVRKGDDVYDHAGDNGPVRKGDDLYDHAGDSGTVRKGDDAYDHAGDSGTVLKDDDAYDHAGDSGTVRKGDDVYDHAGDSGTVPKGDDVYDHAGDNGTVRKDDDLYDHTGDNGTVRKGDDLYDHTGDNGTVRKGDDLYDHTGDNGTVRKGDDDYDHTGDNGTVRKGDDLYDHTGDNGTVRKGDDDYDHTGDNGTVRKGDDLYVHAGDKADMKGPAETRHDIDTQVDDAVGGTENGNALLSKTLPDVSEMPGTTDTDAEIYYNLREDDSVYNNQGQATDPCVDEDSCYYNIR